MYYSGFFAGIDLIFHFHYPETAQHYGDVLTETTYCKNEIIIPADDIEGWMKQWNVPDAAYAEYVMSCSYACDSLLRYQRIVFHGCSFLWHGIAYLFSAPSGTGKTTQARLWKELFPDEIEILNGDKPILEVNEEGNVIVHPSPWKGKEGYGRDDIAAPLGGIIVLRQAPQNSIRPMEPAEAAKNLFGRSYSTFNTEKEVINTAEMIEKIVMASPVWLLSNRGDKDSARMTYHTLTKEGH